MICNQPIEQNPKTTPNLIYENILHVRSYPFWVGDTKTWVNNSDKAIYMSSSSGANGLDPT